MSRCYTRSRCGGIVRCNGLFDGDLLQGPPPRMAVQIDAELPGLGAELRRRDRPPVVIAPPRLVAAERLEWTFAVDTTLGTPALGTSKERHSDERVLWTAVRKQTSSDRESANQAQQRDDDRSPPGLRYDFPDCAHFRPSNGLPFSGEAAAEPVFRCYTRSPCGGIVRCNGLFDGQATEMGTKWHGSCLWRQCALSPWQRS